MALHHSALRKTTACATACIMLLAGTATGWQSPAMAGQGAAVPVAADRMHGPDNAALLYWRAWALAGPEAIKVVEDGRANMDAGPLGTVPMPEAMSKALVELDGTVSMVLRATRLPRCDFGVEWEQGFMAVMPELGWMRKSARMLDADARRLGLAGNLDAAVERIEGIFRLADHVGQNSPLIGHLVAVAVASLGCNTAQEFADSGKLTAAARDRLLAAVQATAKSPSLSAKAALGVERKMMSTWIRAELAKRPGAEVMRILQTADGGTPLPPGLPKEEKALKAELARQTEVAGAYIDRIIAAWDGPTAEAEFGAIDKAVEENKLREPLVALILPALKNVRASGQRYDQLRADTAKKLMAAKVVGESK